MAALERMLENSDLDKEVLEDFGILSISQTKKKLEKLIYESNKDTLTTNSPGGSVNQENKI